MKHPYHPLHPTLVLLDTPEYDRCLHLMWELEQLDHQQHSAADVVRLIVRDWLKDGKVDKLRE